MPVPAPTSGPDNAGGSEARAFRGARLRGKLRPSDSGPSEARTLPRERWLPWSVVALALAAALAVFGSTIRAALNDTPPVRETTQNP